MGGIVNPVTVLARRCSAGREPEFGQVVFTAGYPRRLADDPFARQFPARILRVDAGLLGTMPAPVGPGTQRYGAGNPWPWDRFGLGSGID